MQLRLNRTTSQDGIKGPALVVGDLRQTVGRTIPFPCLDRDAPETPFPISATLERQDDAEPPDARRTRRGVCASAVLHAAPLAALLLAATLRAPLPEPAFTVAMVFSESPVPASEESPAEPADAAAVTSDIEATPTETPPSPPQSEPPPAEPLQTVEAVDPPPLPATPSNPATIPPPPPLPETEPPPVEPPPVVVARAEPATLSPPPLPEPPPIRAEPEQPINRKIEPPPLPAAKPRPSTPLPSAPVARVEPVAPSALPAEAPVPPAQVAARPAPAKAAAPPPDYLALLRARLERSKRYPRAAQQRHQEGEALLWFAIDRDGNVLEWRLTRSSGHETLDKEVAAMIRRAAPLPALPETVAAGRLELVLPVSFVLR